MRHRIHLAGAREAIGHALALVEPFAQAIGPVEFVVGVDPGFAGLHSYDEGIVGSYSETAHACWPFHLDGPADRKCTTIVLPTASTVQPSTVVHELGHALDYRLGFHHHAQPITDYAHTNRYEAFAEAFVSRWYVRGDIDPESDRATTALWESLLL